MIRVALIGNMNNNFFAITRHLRDLGYDAHLFYRVAMDHFQPSADSWNEDYLSYCHEIDWLDNGVCNIDEGRIKEQLTRFDFYIGQGDEAAAAHRAGINMDVYYPYGSDVYKYAQLQQRFLFRHKVMYYLQSRNYAKTKRMLQKGTPAKSMRGVIVNARHVWVDYTNEDFEAKLRNLNCKGQIDNVPMPFVYPPAYLENVTEPQFAHWSHIIENAMQKYGFLILYHGRQEWKSKYNEFTPKNTHNLILGFADYIKQRPGSACLVMLEYGYDLAYSKELVKELGIEEQVVWLPKMSRKEIMLLISKVNVCSGEFGRSYLTFGTIVEAMLMGKPVIHHRDDKLYENTHLELYPLLNAREPQEIKRAIAFAVDNPEEIRRMGEDASRWIQQYLINHPLERLTELIQNKVVDSGYAPNHQALSKV